MFKKKDVVQNASGRINDFAYIDSKDIYMDSSCQTMRPAPVISAITDYYQKYNACGGRVKYEWGQKVDGLVEETRELILDYLGLSEKNYVCSFTLNTSYGLNLILNQLPLGKFKSVITSEIEHNSVFLTTIELAKRLDVPRIILERQTDGTLIYDKAQLEKAVVVVNAVSNIDARTLKNIKEVVSDTHKAGGIVIIDAAQAMGNSHEILQGCDPDAICFSAHKMYAASFGGIVISKKLLKSLDLRIVGGGMVTAVRENDYDIVESDMASWLEPGLQAYGEIISLNSAIKWKKNLKIEGQKPTDYVKKLSTQLFEGLSEIPGIHIINSNASPVISFYFDKIDAHRLAVFLSSGGIMARSGYFCCHYYLIEKMNYPPLLRLSIGLNNTSADIQKTVDAIKRITKG